MKIQVRNLRSNSGREVPNQFEIEFGGNRIFQSYKTVVAVRTKNGNIYLDNNALNHSNTTTKYLANFLGFDTAKEMRKAIKESGRYVFVDIENELKDL